MTPDALVSEHKTVSETARDLRLASNQPGFYHSVAASLVGRTAEIDDLRATIDRLTRERDDWKSKAELWFSQGVDNGIRAETAEAERDEARRELAECRNKALEEAAAEVETKGFSMIDCNPNWGPFTVQDKATNSAIEECAKLIRALKTEA